MGRRWRTVRYGAAAGLTLVGIACGATIPGTLGGTLATVLIGIGLVGVVSLVFYEVGLSEDRDRARLPGGRPEDRAESASMSAAPRRQPAVETRVRPRRLNRARGEHRRLR